MAQRPGQLIAEPVSEYGVPRSNYIGMTSDVDRNASITATAGPWPAPRLCKGTVVARAGRT